MPTLTEAEDAIRNDPLYKRMMIGLAEIDEAFVESGGHLAFLPGGAAVRLVRQDGAVKWIPIKREETK